MTETRCGQIGTWKLIRRRPTLALTKSECLRKSSPYRRPYIFPTSIVAELNEICKSLGYTPEQLVIEALKGQIDCWNEFHDHVMTLPVEPEDFVWHKDPVFCLACVTTVHIINNFARCSHDPVAFAQLKADAPTEWSFSSLEEGEEIDAADWWKTRS